MPPSQPDILAALTGWNPPIFNGRPQDDVELWLSAIRLGLKQRKIPQEHWVVIALHFMADEPREVLDDARRTLGMEKWEWDTLTMALVYIQKKMRQDEAEHSHSVGHKLRRFRRDHPYAAAAAGIGLVTVGGITVAPAVLVGTLNLLGFSATGVVSGSIAAGIQSAVYGGAVASGSLFSMAQAATMGGIAVAAVPVQALSAGAIGVGALLVKKSGCGVGRQDDDTDTEYTTEYTEDGASTFGQQEEEGGLLLRPVYGASSRWNLESGEEEEEDSGSEYATAPPSVAADSDDEERSKL
ncbi:hypothetical protein FB45DRAFT_935949 [Roridomyces roridus]|uniref:Uncharacterized protein n=1 Tax=Roridomyces roridus TaxID=1738132 RepID=A0AAD7FCD3_9AGAR|nr:hypothetical protein FB45DRAFT_935949 [Roridomyces roridus]